MTERRKTRCVKIGTLLMGGANPIPVQSMTKVLTTDIVACVRQIRKLQRAGCGLVRIAVPTRKDTEAFGEIVQKVSIPLIADIHFSPERAIEAIEAGAAKIRLNPGNLKDPADLLRIIACAKTHGTAVRIGVNEASIRDLKDADIPPQQRIDLMLREMKEYIRLFEKQGFENLVLSAKSADPRRTIAVNRAISKSFDYPLHIGLTHAGLPEDAIIPSAAAIGTLLAEGIGDTVRVSIAGDPVQEVRIARQILNSLGLMEDTGPQLIVCPTCGRCQIDVVKLAKKIRRELRSVRKPIRIAVMGCVVNGPGEAADADLAVCAAAGKGFLYCRGKKIASVPETRLLEAFRRQLTFF